MSRSKFREKSVLVTGGAGAIGSRLTRRLLDSGASVVVLDDLSSGYSWNLPTDPALTVIEGDVADPAVLKRAFRADPSIVFHLAAFFANQQSVEDPERDLQTNGFGILRTLQASAAGESVQRFVYASSSCVYSGSGQSPSFEETDPLSLEFHTPYELTKTLGEGYCTYFDEGTALETVRARIFNSYGPGEVPGRYRNVIPKFVYLAMNGEPLPITGSGAETRDFTYVGDIVDGLMALGRSADVAGEAVNLATGSETRIDRLAELVNGAVGNDAGIEYRQRRDWDSVDRRSGSIERARERIGYDPSVEIEEGLRRTVEWFDNNWEQIFELAEVEELRPE